MAFERFFEQKAIYRIFTDFLDITFGVPQGSIFGFWAFYHFCVSN